jgi:hypothetical protein
LENLFKRIFLTNPQIDVESLWNYITNYLVEAISTILPKNQALIAALLQINLSKLTEQRMEFFMFADSNPLLF